MSRSCSDSDSEHVQPRRPPPLIPCNSNTNKSNISTRRIPPPLPPHQFSSPSASDDEAADAVPDDDSDDDDHHPRIRTTPTHHDHDHDEDFRRDMIPRRHSALHVFDRELSQSFNELEYKLNTPMSRTIHGSLSLSHEEAQSDLGDSHADETEIDAVTSPSSPPPPPPSELRSSIVVIHMNRGATAPTSSTAASPSTSTADTATPASPSVGAVFPSPCPCTPGDATTTPSTNQDSSDAHPPAVTRSVSASTVTSSSSSLLSSTSSTSSSSSTLSTSSNSRQRFASSPAMPSSTLSRSQRESFGLGSYSNSNKVKCELDGCTSFAVRYNHCLRHQWRLNLQEDVTSVDGQSKRSNPGKYKVAHEIVTTERSYCDGLKAAYRAFYLRLRTIVVDMDPTRSSSLVSQSELEEIFGNLEDLYKLSEHMVTDLEELVVARLLVEQIGTTLLHWAPQFRIFQSYLENYDDAIRRLQQLRKERSEFDFFCRVQERCEGLSLESFLIMPVQRLPRYLLLLQELIKRCEDEEKQNKPNESKQTDVAEGDEEKDGDDADAGEEASDEYPFSSSLRDMYLAKDKISLIASSINSSLHAKDRSLQVAAIQAKFERDTRYQDLVAPNRYLVRQGSMKKRYGKDSRHLSSSTHYHFFLFNDILVYADTRTKNVLGRGNGVTYKLRHILPLNEMEVEPIAGNKGKNKELRISFNRGQHSNSTASHPPATTPSWMNSVDSQLQRSVSAADATASPATGGGRGGVQYKEFVLCCTDQSERDSWVHSLRKTIRDLQESQRQIKIDLRFDGTATGTEASEQMVTNHSKLKAIL